MVLKLCIDNNLIKVNFGAFYTFIELICPYPKKFGYFLKMKRNLNN